MMKKTIILIIALFVILGVLGFWYWSKNPYSKDVLKIEILGPTEANFSEEVEYTVKYKNNGNIRLEQPRMIFEFPENTLVGDSFIRRKEVNSEELGDIYPGEEKTYTFKGRIFGKENDLKTANVWLNYQPKNLKARYESSTSFTTKIKTVPLTFDFDLPSRIESNKDFDFSVNYYSALDYPLSNLTVKIQYPDKFEFTSSKPASLGKSEWDIALLNKAEGGRIDVRGKMVAELGEQKIFNAQLGMWRDGEFILLKEVNRGIEIIQPNLSVFRQVNGQNNYIASPGEILHYEIFFRNLGEEPFKDLFLVVRLDGQGVDFDSVKTSDGQIEEGNNGIVWDWHNVSSLKFLDQGEEGKVEFWVNVKEDWNIGSSSKSGAVIKDTVLVSKIKKEFETKVSSKLSVSSQLSHNSGIFQDTGPTPPLVGQSTTYTITWQAKNFINDVNNVKVKAILPQNVRLTGKTHPQESSSNFAFDSQSREIVWMVGNMAAGSGVLNDPPSISFQVEVIPNQRGERALLIDQVRITGEDQWTGKTIEGTAFSVRTPEAAR